MGFGYGHERVIMIDCMAIVNQKRVLPLQVAFFEKGISVSGYYSKKLKTGVR